MASTTAGAVSPADTTGTHHSDEMQHDHKHSASQSQQKDETLTPPASEESYHKDHDNDHDNDIDHDVNMSDRLERDVSSSELSDLEFDELGDVVRAEEGKDEVPQMETTDAPEIKMEEDAEAEEEKKGMADDEEIEPAEYFEGGRIPVFRPVSWPCSPLLAERTELRLGLLVI